MVSRRQLRFFAAFTGIMIGLVASCFASESLIRWAFAAPFIIVGLVLWMLGSESRAARRGMGRAR